MYLYLYSYLFRYYYWGDRACEASSASISALIDSFVERKTTSVLLLPVQISSFQYIMCTVYTSIKLTKARTDNGTPDVELKIHQQTNRYSSPPSPLQTRTFNKYTYTNIHTCKNVHKNLSRWTSNIFRPEYHFTFHRVILTVFSVQPLNNQNSPSHPYPQISTSPKCSILSALEAVEWDFSFFSVHGVIPSREKEGEGRRVAYWLTGSKG